MVEGIFKTVLLDAKNCLSDSDVVGVAYFMLSTEMAPGNSSIHPVRGVKLKVIKKPTPLGMSFSILYGVPSYRDVVNAAFAWSKKLSPRLELGT